MVEEDRATATSDVYRKLPEAWTCSFEIYVSGQTATQTRSSQYFAHSQRGGQSNIGVASWCTAVRAPRLPAIYFLTVNFTAVIQQRLCAVASPNVFVFCDSSCGSSVAAT